MRVCIHRGANEIGGTAIEVEASGKRLLLDCGLPLDADPEDDTLLPDMLGLRTEDPSLALQLRFLPQVSALSARLMRTAPD